MKIMFVSTSADAKALPSSPPFTLNLSARTLWIIVALLAFAIAASLYFSARAVAKRWIELRAPVVESIVAEIESRQIARETALREDNARVVHAQIAELSAELVEMHGRGAALAERLGMKDFFAETPQLHCNTQTSATNFAKNMEQTQLAATRMRRRFSALIEYGATAAVTFDTIPLVRPVLGANWLSSKFGYRKDPFTKRRTFHAGYDYAARQGTPILAGATGEVIYAGRLGNYGKAVRLLHGDSISTLYGHMHKIYVKRGQFVRRGDIIGEVGNTGRSTGPHLHYEVRVNNRPRPINRTVKQLRQQRAVPAAWAL